MGTITLCGCSTLYLLSQTVSEALTAAFSIFKAISKHNASTPLPYIVQDASTNHCSAGSTVALEFQFDTFCGAEIFPKSLGKRLMAPGRMLTSFCSATPLAESASELTDQIQFPDLHPACRIGCNHCPMGSRSLLASRAAIA